MADELSDLRSLREIGLIVRQTDVCEIVLCHATESLVLLPQSFERSPKIQQ